MARHDGRIAALSPEGGIFEQMAGRYSANGVPNLDVYLKGHAGDTIRVDRIGRPPEFVLAPALTLGLAVQPDVVRGIHRKPGFRGRGLLARFWYAEPESLVGRRVINPPPVPDLIRDAYGSIVRAVLDLNLSTDGDGSPQPHCLELSDAAAAHFVAFEEELEPRLDELGDLSPIADWAAKLAGAIARLAGLLHVVRYANGGAPWDVPISAETMAAAIEIGRDFLIPHALAAFNDMGADPVVEEARQLLRWLESRPEVEIISRRDLHQQLRRRFPKPEDLDPPLRLLVVHHYLREVAAPKRDEPRGRRSSPQFEINPFWRSQNAPNSRKWAELPHSESSVNFVNERGEGNNLPDEFEEVRI